MLTRHDLCARVGITKHDRVFWLGEGDTHCGLQGTVLTVPDATAARFVERNWGEAMRAEIPGLRIQAVSAPQKPTREKKSSVFKPGREQWLKNRLGGME